MKKIAAAILVFDCILGLLLFAFYGYGKHARTEPEGFAEAGNLMIKTGEETEEGKKIALTFDDGPHFRYTEEILDGLKERGAYATFFVTGEHAALHPEIVKRIQEEGHLIGNHTYSHMQLTKGNRKEFKAELIKTNELLEELTGEEITYVRPPYGSWDKKFEKDLNMILNT